MTTVPARVTWLTDALVAPPTEDVGSEELAALRAGLVHDLQVLGADLPHGERLQIDAFRLLVAHRHPERCLSIDETFSASPRLCRRAVGVAAVNRCVRHLSPAPAAAVAEVLAEGLDDAAAATDTGALRAPWWAQWYLGLPSGGRAVVRAEAVTWATQLLVAVDWPRLGRLVIGGRDDWWQCPGAPLVLKGRADVRCLEARRPALLVVGAGRCQADWRVQLGYPALVGGLGRDAHVVPQRVVGVWPQSGQIRVLHVDLATLRDSAAAVVAAVATWVDTRIELRRATLGAAPGALAASVDGGRG